MMWFFTYFVIMWYIEAPIYAKNLFSHYIVSLWSFANNTGEVLEWNWQSVTKLNWVKNAIMQATYFFVILFYTERIWLLMRNLVTILPKLSRKFQHFNTVDRSIKILKNSWIFKNNNENEKFKIFCKAQTASRLKKIIQPLPSLRLLNKTLLRLWNWTKILLRRYIEICRHLLSMCLKNAVLGCQEMV